MSRWIRIIHDQQPRFGLLEGDAIRLCSGDMLDSPEISSETIPLASATLLPPVEPRQFLGLWNNLEERRIAENNFTPQFPLWFVKLPTSVIASGMEITRPPSFRGKVKFEAELGIVIGRECFDISTEEVDDYIFGYTCVNDVTAPETLFEEEGFTHWCRAKSYRRFGPIGPVIATGIDPDNLDSTMHDVFAGRTTAQEIVVTRDGNPALLPSSIDLAGAEVHLLTKTGREFVLARALRPIAKGYDYVLIDCGPSLGILTINGLTAADYVVIPFQCDTLSQRGVGQLLETVADVRAFTNEDLRVLGGVATMYDSRTRLANQVLEDVADRYQLQVLTPPIPKSVRVAEAPGRGRSVLTHARTSKPALAYRELAQTMLAVS